MSADICAQPATERPATTAYVERRLGYHRTAMVEYLVKSQRELWEALNTLQAQIADLSAQVEETAALLLRLEERTRE